MNDTRPRSSLPAVLLVLGLAVLGVFLASYFRPQPVLTDPALLRSGEGVSVESSKDSLAFVPARSRGAGLVFYPGARVPAEAYAYLGQALARKGHLAVIARFPLYFALFAPSRAADIMKDYPEEGSWVVGGHSLGGAMAASWLHSSQEMAKGLLLVASYPPKGADFSSSDLPVLSLYASRDGLASASDMEASRPLLPVTARFVVIEGGNHAGFGDYGRQKGDGLATIEGARQRSATVDEVISLLDMVD